MPPAESPADTGEKRINWTELEADAVAANMVNLRLNDLNSTMDDLFNQAQHNVLPKHRWRNVNINYSPAITNRVAKMVRGLLERATEEPEPEFIQVETPAPVPPLPELLAKAPTEALLAEIFGRVVRGVDHATATMEKVANLTFPAAGAPPVARPVLPTMPPESPKPRTVRIYVHGLLKDQANEVETKTRHLPVELRFGGQEKGKGGALNIPQSCEYAIMFWSMRHAHSAGAKEHFRGQDGQRVFLVTQGGMTTVLDTINEILRKEKLV